MHLNIKEILKLGVCCAGVATAAYVGVEYWNFLKSEFPDRFSQATGAPIPIKPLAEATMPQKYDGPPFVPVGVVTQAVYTTEYGPVVHMRFVDLDVERCPVYSSAEWRYSKSSPPAQNVLLRAEGSWCLEVKPGQRLQPRTLTGDLLDYRSDSFLVNDSRVEYVDIIMSDGTEKSIFTGAVSVCDNDGVCAASVATELAFPSSGMSFRMPMVNHGDVVKFGPRAGSGLRDDSAAVLVESFAAIQAAHESLLQSSPAEVDIRDALPVAEVDAGGEYSAVEDDFSSLLLEPPEPVEVSPVYEDDDIVVNTLPLLKDIASQEEALDEGEEIVN